MIKISELSKTFQAGKRKIHAVKSVSFDVDHGQVFGLLGPNGAGKTTTMRMILGLLGPDAGFAEIAGIRSNVYPDEIKRRVGFLSASAGVYQWLSGLEVLPVSYTHLTLPTTSNPKVGSSSIITGGS